MLGICYIGIGFTIGQSTIGLRVYIAARECKLGIERLNFVEVHHQFHPYILASFGVPCRLVF